MVALITAHTRRTLIEVTRIPDRAWLVRVVDTDDWAEVHRFATVPAAVRDLIGPGPTELTIRVLPDQCGECGEPIYLVNPDTADDLGDVWLNSTGRPICTSTIRKVS